MNDKRPIAQRLAGLRPNQRHKLNTRYGPSHHECAFCKRSCYNVPQRALWQYSVRRWICDECKDERTSSGEATYLDMEHPDIAAGSES
ncbi:unnamed protein product [marine sediment metagenome]|uniref:Uncharacterized protein n=1 Tax=marine sediment metagenome TaxID=412755 RepID=X0VJJ2_9ZZZZ